MLKRLSILLVLVCIQVYNVKSSDAFYPEANFFAQDENYFLHTIERGQTVYSIAVMYHVSVDAIFKLNPESKTIIRSGDKLKIPQESGSYIYHTIQPRETLYALSQKYEVKGEDIVAANPGLSVATFLSGKTIRIPVNMVTTPIQGGNEAVNSAKTNSLLSQTYPSESVKVIKIALLLPFGSKGNAASGVSFDRWVEYYEGFLLALQDIKKKGISVDLQVYDTGSDTKEVVEILKKKEIQSVNLLIGGLYDEQIKLISRYSKDNEIPYVIPFTSKSDEPFNNPNVYQINTPQSYLYSKASLAFIERYKNDNIILVSDATNSEFITTLKSDMDAKKVHYKTVAVENLSNNVFTTNLSPGKKNILVPYNDYSQENLATFTTQLKTFVATNPDYGISIFGYPNWQVQGAKYSEDFFRLNASFYSVFYTNPTDPEVKTFYNTFYKWYSRIISNSFPKYSILGYDTGMYFIQVIDKFGASFSKHVNEFDYKGIQMNFHFERINNWSGFINTNLFIVDFNPDYSITKNTVK
jgi:LysM repeat protein/ribosomal protein L7Ae-like RNA K-turn-binding protein